MVGEVKLMPYKIISGFDKQIQAKLGPERVTNMYIIYSQDKENPPALYDLPGIQKVYTIGSNTQVNCRSLLTQGAFIYAVYGNQVYRIDSNGTLVTLGTLATDQGVVRTAVNQDQIIWVDGINGYVWNYKTETAIFPIPRSGTSPNFPFQPLDITNLDGYGVAIQGQSNNWYWSALNDFTIWNVGEAGGAGGGQAQIQSNPTTCQAITNINRKLFIFGQTVTEPWFDDPVNPAEPFQRNNNLIFQFGTSATGSVVTNFGYVVWLATTINGFDSVKISDGGFPTSISSPEIEYIFREYEQQYGVTDAVAMMYKENGHIFYEIAFPAANHTWVCDISSPNPQEAWFERAMNSGDRFIGQFYANFNGTHYVGSAVDNRLFMLSADIGTYDVEVFLRSVIGSTYESETLKKTSIVRWQFDMKMGNGTSANLPPPATPTQDPICYLSMSHDSGVSFGNRVTANMGKIGERDLRLYFNRLGTHQMFTPKLEFYNNIPTALIRSVITIQECLR